MIHVIDQLDLKLRSVDTIETLNSMVLRTNLGYEFLSMWCQKKIYNAQDLLQIRRHAINRQGPLLLTWFNFNPSMDK